MDWFTLMPVYTTSAAFAGWLVWGNSDRIVKVVKSRIPRGKRRALQESFAFKDLYDWKKARRAAEFGEWHQDCVRLLGDLRRAGKDDTLMIGNQLYGLRAMSNGTQALVPVERTVPQKPKAIATGRPGTPHYASDASSNAINRVCQQRLQRWFTDSMHSKRDRKDAVRRARELAATHFSDWNSTTWGYYRLLVPNDSGTQIMNADGVVIAQYGGATSGY